MNIRAITYRFAINAFVFSGLWFVFGALLLWSPLPGSMGIGGPMFAAWVILFFLALAISGSLLTIAALNAAFPRRPARTAKTTPARTPPTTMWAPPASPSAPSGSGSPRDR